ncbi:MAG: threonylcarbamoyl-AMP synthase [Prevotella sp.]|nr:threonylcarbamoyl-AMP synthase [Prevotella sp.]
MQNPFYDKDIKAAIEVMKKGGVILYPTDTVWGIGCDATNPEAVEKVFKIKHREDSKALICLVDSEARLQRYVRDVPNVAWDIIELATKPVTVILDGAVNLAHNLMAEDGSVALRVTREPFSNQLCYRFQKPIVSTSANISGEPPASNFKDIAPDLLEAVDYVCTSRRQEKKPHTPSSIVRLRQNGEVEVIRR